MALETSKEYGKRLIPQILDSLALSEPDRIIYSVANFSDVAHDFRHISARNFAQAVDKTAWWLHDQVGKPKSIQTVGYIGPRERETNLPDLSCYSSPFANCTKMTFATFY